MIRELNEYNFKDRATEELIEEYNTFDFKDEFEYSNHPIINDKYDYDTNSYYKPNERILEKIRGNNFYRDFDFLDIIKENKIRFKKNNKYTVKLDFGFSNRYKYKQVVIYIKQIDFDCGYLMQDKESFDLMFLMNDFKNMFMSSDFLCIKDLEKDLIYLSKIQTKYYQIQLIDILKEMELKNEHKNIKMFIDYKNYQELEKQKRKRIKNSVCYIIKDKITKYYKIGYSSTPIPRENTLQSQKPVYEIIKIFKKNHEAKLHEEYKKQRVRGEWFNLSNIQVKYICTHFE